LKYEPKDQVTLMTIGELVYPTRRDISGHRILSKRAGADFLSATGFLTKAIAVYKRIAKAGTGRDQARSSGLPDLYVQQGVMSEARPLFFATCGNSPKAQPADGRPSRC